MNPVELVIAPRARNIGSLPVQRLLPLAKRRNVGPFVFFDRMGPVSFAPGAGMDVKPHPHIGLATVTYLFEGAIQHRDSMGYDQIIEPGAINWMTSGRGCVHSERTPAELRNSGSPCNGLQLWVALPKEFEECAPTFQHHPANTLPQFSAGDAEITLLLGRAFGHESPVQVLSKLFYIQAKIPQGGRLNFPCEGMEAAAFVMEGEVSLHGQPLKASEMGVLRTGEDMDLRAAAPTLVMLIGGEPLGERFIDWNFVSSSKERIEEVKKEWSAHGPRPGSLRFPPVPGDDEEFIPL